MGTGENKTSGKGVIILSFRQRNRNGDLRTVKFHIGKKEPVKIEYEGEEFMLSTERAHQIALEVVGLLERFDNTLPKTHNTKPKRRKSR